MSAHRPKSITTMTELLAHAVELEIESAECYRILADSMATHNNRPAANLFNELAHAAEERATELQQRAGDTPLPELAPWEHHCAQIGSVAHCMSEAHYQMTPGQALELVIRNERRNHGCLLRMAAEIRAPELHPAATAMATEKEHQIEMLTGRLSREAMSHGDPPEDLDPPNVPE